jgi:hypothetical protein
MHSLLMGSFFLLTFCVQFLARSSVFWDVTQSVLLVSYRPFGTTYQSHLQGSSRTVVLKNYHSALHKVPKIKRSHLIVDYTFPAEPVLFLMENQL